MPPAKSAHPRCQKQDGHVDSILGTVIAAFGSQGTGEGVGYRINGIILSRILDTQGAVESIEGIAGPQAGPVVSVL